MTETIEGTVTWLSQEAYDRLSKELEYLSGPGRVEISSKIEQAREEGDLRENGGYHAAKEEQGKQEARIRQLEHLLRHARVGEGPQSLDKVAAGLIITVAFGGDDSDTERFLLGSREDTTGDDSLPIYSAAAPLGQAITGLKVGQSTSFELPNGKSMAVKVLAIEAYRA